MKKLSQKMRIVSVPSALMLLAGCASVIPPPDRIYWNEVSASTQCTEDSAAVSAEYIGSLLAAGLGGWEIGAGIVLGYVPVVGFTLATLGILGGVDSEEKFKQVRQCKEFKQYVALRESRSGTVQEPSTAGRLLRLDELLESGLITEAEYRSARQRVLDGL